MVYIPLANNFARAWYSMVVVDEAQDMNYAQLLLAQKACKRTGRIVVVGDDCQAIYGFRGADADGLDRLKPSCAPRSWGSPSRTAAAVASWTWPPRWSLTSSPAPMNADGKSTDGHRVLVAAAKPGDFVLSRKNAPLMPLCLSFLKQGVRARIEGRDIGAGLRALVTKFRAKSVPQFIDRVQGLGAQAGSPRREDPGRDRS